MTAPVDMGLDYRTEREAFTFHHSKPIGWKVVLLQAEPSERTDVIITLLGEGEIIVGTTKLSKLPGAFEDLPAAFDMPHGVVQDSRIQHGLGLLSNCPRHLVCRLLLEKKKQDAFATQ